MYCVAYVGFEIIIRDVNFTVAEIIELHYQGFFIQERILWSSY